MKRKRLKIRFIRVPHQAVRDLKAAELQVWCAIQLHAPTYSVTVYTLMQDLDKSRSTLQPLLASLLQKGYVSATHMVEHNGALRYKALIPNTAKV